MLRTKRVARETLFVLRVVKRGKMRDLEWKIPKVNLQKTAEVYGHLQVIMKQLEKDLGEAWSGHGPDHETEICYIG